jgi:hypothetical protein
MILANYIKDLLFRYDCVIIPSFGGFVTNKVSATFQEETSSFSPPYKQISFNNNLKDNDGLLANHIASVESISFEKANKFIEDSVFDWKKIIEKETLEIEKLGCLKLNDRKQIIFNPTNDVNYLTSSFGLSSVTQSSLKRYKEVVTPLVTPNVTITNNISTLIKYAASAAILLTLGFLGTNLHQENKQQEILAVNEKALEKKIQSATFTITNPLPTIELNAVKEIKTPFHIVAGSFQFPENAKRKVKQLEQKGYNAKIIGTNKWGLTQVAFKSFTTRIEATKALYNIKKTESKDAWLLVK